MKGIALIPTLKCQLFQTASQMSAKGSLTVMLISSSG